MVSKPSSLLPIDPTHSLKYMHLNAAQTRSLSAVLEVLTQPSDNLSLRQRLVAPLSQLLNADYVASLVWDASAQRFCDGVSTSSNPQHIAAYEARYQFEDPLPRLLHARRYPTLVTDVLPQREFVRSDFFNAFMRSESMYWGVNVFAHDGRQDVGDLRIWRSRSKGNFQSDELEALRLIYPSLVHALSGAQKLSAPQARTASAANASMTDQTIDQQLAYQYGLSQREFQVAQCVAQGLSDKEIAKAVGIGFTTVRTYLSQIFKKTHCANRKELIAYLCSRQRMH
jgi:DNA-binding CsgD family transcriptional regulator